MWSSLQDATAPAATAVAAAPIGRAAWERVRAAWRAAHIFAAFFERCPYGARRLLAPAFYSQMGLEASAARAICSTPCAPSAEASKELLPSFLAAQGRARRAFAQSARGKLYGWRQDVVVEASSGVVHASLQASQARIKKSGCLARESQLVESSQVTSFFRACKRYDTKNWTRSTYFCSTIASEWLQRKKRALFDAYGRGRSAVGLSSLHVSSRGR